MVQSELPRTVPNSKGKLCLYASKPKEIRTGVFSKERRGLSKEMTLNPEMQVSLCSKACLLDGSPVWMTGDVGENSFVMLAKGVGVVGSID